MILAFLFLNCLILGHGYPGGAPVEVCGDMFPQHYGSNAQTAESPFYIQVDQTSYMPGSLVNVYIRAKKEVKFKGFFLQARQAACKSADFEVAVGEFFTVGVDNEVQLRSCKNKSNNAVTHTSKDLKTTKTFTWRNRDGGDVFFQATFVQDYSTLWTGVKSKVIADETIDQVQEHPDCPTRDKVDMHPTSSSTRALVSVVTILGMLFLIL